MLILRKRVHYEELMDQPDISRAELERSLSDLEIVNRWLGGMAAIRPHILPVMNRFHTILDVACGGGEVLRMLADCAREKALKVDFVGIDVNPRVIDIASSRSEANENIRFFQADARSLPFNDQSFDLVISSTFLHHLKPGDAVLALKEAARVTRHRMVFVDLIRSDICWIGILILSRLIFGRISHHDGPVSFRKAYIPSELLELASQAGIGNSNIYNHPFCRMALVWDRGG